MLEQVAELVGRDDPQVDVEPGVRAAARAGVVAGAPTARSTSSSAKASTAPPDLAVAMMSRSLTESARRRGDAGQLDAPRRPGARAARAMIASAISARAGAACAASGVSATPRSNDASTFSSNFGAEALHVAQLLGLGGGAQRVERVDPEVVVELARALGPEARQARHLDQPRRELRAQRAATGFARVEQRDELVLQRLADARQLA